MLLAFGWARNWNSHFSIWKKKKKKKFREEIGETWLNFGFREKKQRTQWCGFGKLGHEKIELMSKLVT